MAPEDQAYPADTLDLINSEIRDRLVRQSDSGSKIDTKASILVGFAATAAQFLASRSFQPILAALAFAAYATSFVCGVAVFRVAAYKDLEPKMVLNLYSPLQKREALIRLAVHRCRIFEQNKVRHDHKAWLWQASLLALSLGLVLSTCAILAHTGSHGTGRPGNHPTPTQSAAAYPSDPAAAGSDGDLSR